MITGRIAVVEELPKARYHRNASVQLQDSSKLSEGYKRLMLVRDPRK